MKPVHCAAVDLGATSGRVIVGTWAGRGLGLTEVHRFPNQFRSLAGHEYWDMPYLWSEVRAGLAKARSGFPRLASVGVDSWAVDHVLVDRRGRPVYPVHAYRDGRTKAASRNLGRHGIERIYALTGVPNYPYNTSLQLQETLSSHPGVGRDAHRCLFVSDFVNFLLSGKMLNELSIASHSQLIDVQGRSWSRQALAFFGIPRRLFGNPARSPRRLGPVRGVPECRGVLALLVPGHDTACAFAAMPAAADGSDLYLSSGTWSLLGFEGARPLLGAEALALRISNERMGDGGYRPLKSCLGLWLLEQTLPAFSARPKTAGAWRQLLAAAQAAREPAGLLDITDATFFNPPSMRAAIDNQLRHRGLAVPGSLASYVRLICDSLGRGHAEAVEAFGHLAGRSFQRILMVGGGSQNRLLCQATADATGLALESFALEGSAVGNLAAQLVALGEISGMDAFRRIHARHLRGVAYAPRSRTCR
ncbi:MAG TPA: FGGY-family carbohydrate kinase [Opitutaceae bacterium]